MNWNKGPALAEDTSEFYVGDCLLVLVECIKENLDGETIKYFWDPHVIICTEIGWDDANGESWSAWDWSDVSYWVKLDKNNLPPLGVPT